MTDLQKLLSTKNFANENFTDHNCNFLSFRQLIENLESVDRERSLLKTELEGLARALSPLKKEVTDVVKRQQLSQVEVENDRFTLEISSELTRVKEELSLFYTEKQALENEQVELENALKVLGQEKEAARQELRYLIQVWFYLFLSFKYRFKVVRSLSENSFIF